MNPLFIAQTPVLPTSLWQIPADDCCGPRRFDVPELQVAIRGEGRRWLRIGGRVIELATQPNMLELYDAGYEIDETRWLGSRGHCVAIRFPQDATQRLAALGHDAFRLTSEHALFDPRVAQLAIELAAEYRRGLPNGILFVEGLSLALLGLLARKYRAGHDLGDARSRVPGLRADQQRRVREYIDSQLDGTLRVGPMAALVAMSEAQFHRCFKRSFGVTPHQYVLQRRLAAAAKALRSDSDSCLAEVALAYGFSSQAHFTHCFRRLFGVTPGSYRRTTLLP